MTIGTYLQSIITLAPGDIPDLYALHDRVQSLTGTNPRIFYSPDRQNAENALMIILRSLPGIDFPDTCPPETCVLTLNQSIAIKAPVRFFDAFDRPVSIHNQAMDAWMRVMEEGGFRVDHAILRAHNFISKDPQTMAEKEIPFWAISSLLTVKDPAKAAKTMVQGVGQEVELGFGMLIFQ